MKYYLRSSSNELETAELSAYATQVEAKDKKGKVKKLKKKAPKTKKSHKKQKNKVDTSKKGILDQENKESNASSVRYHQKILRFPSKYQKKTIRIYCFKESDLRLQRRFSRCVISHHRDDDQDSWDSLIQAQVQRCKKDLFQSIRKNSESHLDNQSGLELNNQGEENFESKPKKGKKKIQKRRSKKNK